MNHILSLILILTPLFVGYLLPANDKITKLASKSLVILVPIILTFIGLEIAQIDNLSSNLIKIFKYVSVVIFLTISFGLIGVALYDKVIQRKSIAVNSNKKTTVSLKGSIIQVMCLIFGVILGKNIPIAQYLPEDSMTGLLMVLIFLVGVELKLSGITLKEVMLNKRGVQISAVFVVSVLCSGVVLNLIYDELSLYQALALVSGFGWYSLSGPIITESFGPIWGSVAMVNDLVRELFSLVFIPLIMRYSPSAALSVGGATSLDFTLPVIQQSGGNQIVPTTISFGFIINLLAPCFMILFCSLG